MKRTLGLFLVCGLLVVAFGGCTPKPNETQLQELSRACAAADEAEASVESAQRSLNSTERSLAQRRRKLEERQNYQAQVRSNLESSTSAE